MKFAALFLLFLNHAIAHEQIFKFYEKKYNLPSNLLQAIAHVESDKIEKGIIQPWPWAINVQGKGYYCSSKEEAIQMLNQLKQQGISSIDVGYMQVNLEKHPQAFDNLSMAFDPKSNIAYAAKYLKSLYNTHQSWVKAIAFYHSNKPCYYQPYLKKINQALKSLEQNNLAYPQQGLVRFASYNIKKEEVLIDVKAKPFVNFAKPLLKVRSYQRALN